MEVNTIPFTKHGDIFELINTSTPQLISNIEECNNFFISDHAVVTF